MKINQTLIGVIGGVALGTTIGVLFAPDKGSNTRKKIIKKNAKQADDLKQKAGELANSASEKYNTLVSKGKESIQKGINDVELQNIKNINKSLGI